MTLPWLLQSDLTCTFVPARGAPPHYPKANGVHRNIGLHRKNSLWTNGARRFYGSRRKDALAFPRPARLLWRPALGRHLQVEAEGWWNGATRDHSPKDNYWPTSWGSRLIPEEESTYSPLFFSIPGFSRFSLLYHPKPRGNPTPWLGLSSHGLEWICTKKDLICAFLESKSHRHLELGCRS